MSTRWSEALRVHARMYFASGIIDAELKLRAGRTRTLVTVEQAACVFTQAFTVDKLRSVGRLVAEAADVDH